MHETGVLGRLLPEWARISFLVQHDFFHKYTVDEHTLRAIDALDELSAGQHPEAAPLARLLDELEDVRALYLGMLLHDIAKGRGGGHVQKGERRSRAASSPASGSRTRSPGRRSSSWARTSRCRRPRSSAT